MRIKTLIITSISFLIILIGLLFVSYFYRNIVLLIITSIIIVVNIIFILGLTVFDLFRRDKILDIEALQAQGLTIVTCSYCNKQNVFEDQYCIYCGEKLKGNNSNEVI